MEKIDLEELKRVPLYNFNNFETEEEKLRKKVYFLEIEVDKLKRKQVQLPERYIINENACILFWKNGEKTIIKRCADDEFNPRLAFLTAFFQHYVDMSKNKANKYLASLQVEENKKFVKVIKRESCFDCYSTWIKKYFPQFFKYFKKEEIPSKNKKYELIGKAEHEREDEMCCLIQDPNTKQVFIMRENAIKEEK